VTETATNAASAEDGSKKAASAEGGSKATERPDEAVAGAAATLTPTAVFGLGRAPGVAVTLRGELIGLIPTALRAAALIVVSLGSVAAVGALMLWIRFDAAGLPADQAISVVPREDLVVVGGVLLAQYVLIGVAAVLLVRFRDPFGNASPATRRALADLVLIELLIAGSIVWAATPETTRASAFWWILAAACLAGARVLLEVSVNSTPIGRRYAQVRAERDAIVAAWSADHWRRRSQDELRGLQSVRASAVGPANETLQESLDASQTIEKALAEAAKLPETGKPPEAAPPNGPPERKRFTLCRRTPPPTGGMNPGEGGNNRSADPTGSIGRLKRQATAAAERVRLAERRLAAARDHEHDAFIRFRASLRSLRQGQVEAAHAEGRLRDRQVEAVTDPADSGHYWWQEGSRLWLRLALRAGALGLGVGAALFTGQEWLAWLVITAAGLALATLGIAQATSDTRFFWTGVALFVSGLLFGWVFTFLRTEETPKLSPVGILLKPASGQDCGRYVTGGFVARTGDENTDKIYYGNAAGSAGHFESGRISSVTNDQVAGYAIGSLDRPYADSASFAETLDAIAGDLATQTGVERCPM
jgi:hypothetical protein